MDHGIYTIRMLMRGSFIVSPTCPQGCISRRKRGFRTPKIPSPDFRPPDSCLRDCPRSIPERSGLGFADPKTSFVRSNSGRFDYCVRLILKKRPRSQNRNRDSDRIGKAYTAPCCRMSGHRVGSHSPGAFEDHNSSVRVLFTILSPTSGSDATKRCFTIV